MTKLQQSLHQLYKDKKILILGIGKEGISTLKKLQELFPSITISTMDLSEGKERYLKNLADFDVIFKTPSIPSTQPELVEFINGGGHITSQLNEFLRVFKKQVIGVTGTKGKSTTTTFIYQLLVNAGKKTLLAGNMGIPPFEIEEMVFDDSLIALEMSSYQLQAVEFSPHWAVWLNLFSEHINYHNTIDQYTEAKAKITLFQDSEDIFVYNQDNNEINTYAQKSLALKHPFRLAKSFSEIEAKLGKELSTQLSDIFLTQDLPAVLQLAEAFSINEEVIVKTVNTFQPLPHRLESILTKSGVVFVDDTLATIPEAAVAAIHSFSQVSVILLGGFDRGIDYTSVIDAVVKNKIPVVIFFKPSGEKMQKTLAQKYPEEKLKTFMVETMKEAVQISYEHAHEGDIVLLSPASPSFGQFQDYQDKAAQFRHWISEFDRA